MCVTAGVTCADGQGREGRKYESVWVLAKGFGRPYAAYLIILKVTCGRSTGYLF